jgi:hypothetical protein
MKTTATFLVVGLMAAGTAAALPLRDSLAMFESGATRPTRSRADYLRGAAGEVSRFQIMPSVWRQYSRSSDYTDPEVAWSVAQRILDQRTHDFQSRTRRAPTPLEIYLLWNKPGHFEEVGYDVSRVRKLYRDRAQRFANLFKRFSTEEVAVGGQ